MYKRQKYIFFWNEKESKNPFLISNFTYGFDFWRKWKITFGKKNSWKGNKNIFLVKMLKLHENYVNTNP